MFRRLNDRACRGVRRALLHVNILFWLMTCPPSDPNSPGDDGGYPQTQSLPPDNAKVGNDLPTLLRGLYFEAWNPMESQGHDDLHDLPASLRAALPHSVCTDPNVFSKIVRLFESRLRDETPTKLDVALNLCVALCETSNSVGDASKTQPS